MRRQTKMGFKGGILAFTVIELLVAVAIMTLIVLALYGMFDQTQRALRGNVNQVDVMESGRAALDLLGREMEQIGASRLSNGLNFYASVSPAPFVVQRAEGLAANGQPVPPRTNILEECFFMMPETNHWKGIGYRVVDATNGVGTLYRFAVSTNRHVLQQSELYDLFRQQTNPLLIKQSTNWARVIDGVVHFRITAFDPDGQQMTYRYPQRTNQFGGYILARQGMVNPNQANVILTLDPQRRTDETQMLFISNAVPAYLSLELGVLDPETWERYQVLQDAPAVARQFLSQRADKLQIFRERIPIRTATQ